MRPSSSLLWATGASLVARACRRATQLLRRPSSLATALAVMPSSWMRESMTRASSMALTVRGGALACSRSRFVSTGSRGCSTTTGTWLAPCAFQRSRRLRPSMTSKEPSAWGTTRRGSSDRPSSADRDRPGPRKAAKLVRRLSGGSRATAGSPASPAVALRVDGLLTTAPGNPGLVP